jgi:hypothetical protein
VGRSRQRLVLPGRWPRVGGGGALPAERRGPRRQGAQGGVGWRTAAAASRASDLGVVAESKGGSLEVAANGGGVVARQP